MGLVSALGQNVEETWRAILAGQSGAGPITRFDTSNSAVRIAAEIKNWDPTEYMLAKEARRRDPYQQFAIAAAQKAVQASGLEINEQNRTCTSVMVGTAAGGIGSYYNEAKVMIETGDPRRISPFGITMHIADGGSNIISMETGATGPSYVPISACATGADCIGVAYLLIQNGRIDRAIAGAGEAPVTAIGIAAFDRTGACSRENDNPAHACRPFSKDRPGLVFGEGAGVVILEELEQAKARGATILAEVIGYGATSDAFHITAPHPEGRGAAEAIAQALGDARLNPEDIHYINAHGTGTSLNDVMETKAVKTVFGQQAYKVPMSSTKSMTGHAMGATAAIEAIFSVLALRDQVAPPTINLDVPDPECDLDYVPNRARELKMTHVMSNSFGFGGHNVSLIFKAFA
jgi:beta-ketoacyl-acyl-carrier-protein synthase II